VNRVRGPFLPSARRQDAKLPSAAARSTSLPPGSTTISSGLMPPPERLRSSLPEVAIKACSNVASKIAPWLFLAGVMLQLPTLGWVGIILFGSSSLFAFLTLPVEFNASTRAQELLLSQGIIKGDEQIAGVQKVLGAAAWTYVAAAVSAIGFWLFFIFVLLSQARPAAVRR
jgi:Zn-dependent membrane protease YugP